MDGGSAAKDCRPRTRTVINIAMKLHESLAVFFIVVTKSKTLPARKGNKVWRKIGQLKFRQITNARRKKIGENGKNRPQ
jgi:hypothetical protein